MAFLLAFLVGENRTQEGLYDPPFLPMHEEDPKVVDFHSVNIAVEGGLEVVKVGDGNLFDQFWICDVQLGFGAIIEYSKSKE